MKRAEVPLAENFPGCPGGCLSAVCVPWSSVCVSGLAAVWSFPVLGWVPVSGALSSSLVVSYCSCLPGSGSCAGFCEKGRRPKGRSRRSFARAGLFQVFLGVLADWSVDIEGVFLCWYISWFYSPSSQLRRFLAKRLHAISTHRRGPVEEPPRAERVSLVSAFCFHCDVPCPTLQVCFLLELFLKLQSPWMCGGNSWVLTLARLP